MHSESRSQIWERLTTDKKSILVFYHGCMCQDGAVCAMLFSLKFGYRVALVPTLPGKRPNVDISGKSFEISDSIVACVDTVAFESIDELTAIASEASAVIVIDHHKQNKELLTKNKLPSNVLFVFDEFKCSAMLTYEVLRFANPELSGNRETDRCT